MGCDPAESMPRRPPCTGASSENLTVTKKTIHELDLKGRRLFVRVDFNVPIRGGVIGDDTRIRAALPTLTNALDRGATLVLGSHLGRPNGAVKPEFSLRPVADRLAELLERRVVFAEDCIGDAVTRAMGQVGARGVVLLENLRFHAGEEANDRGFATALAAPADCYVNDAFGTAHRAHASTAGIVNHLPDAAAGLLMARELRYLGGLLQSPSRPFVAILGGAKVSGKMEVIENLLGRVDALLIGGAMAYTFFKAQGLAVGRSLVEDTLMDATRTIERTATERGVRLELPSDHVVTPRLEADAAHDTLAVDDPTIGDRLGVDIGPETVRRFADVIGAAKTIVWNGPMGVFEIEAFAPGTMAIAKAVANSGARTIVGGGDSVAAVGRAGVADQITHISTGGGASLELLGGRRLPGLDVLPDAGEGTD